MIGKLKKIFETQTTILQKKAGVFKNEEIVCAVDEETVPCDTLQDVFFSPEARGGWTGIPAPPYLEDDPWFGPAIKSEKQITHEQMLEEAERREEENRKELTNEPENIHQVMYEMATQNSATTLQLDPIGGSENFQSGPGGWNSGNGMSQFRS